MQTSWLVQWGPALKAVEWSLLVLLVCLLVAVPVVFAVRLRALKRASGNAAHWVEVLSGGLRQGEDLPEAGLADGGRNLPERLAGFALSHSHLCPDALERLLEAREIEDKRQLERGIPFLGTVGSNAPFVGLTGTVLGVLGAFQQMSATGTSGGPGVMAAIAGALVATAAGLFVAIPAVVFHNALQGRVDWILEESRQLRTILVARSLQAVAMEERA